MRAELAVGVVLLLVGADLVRAQEDGARVAEPEDADPAPDEAESTDSTPSADQLTPPVVQTRVDAVYPPSLAEEGHAGRVALAVTVLADGRVGDVEVLASGGEAFDRAAISAVVQWTFSPATRGEAAIASRIRVPFVFVPPAEPVAPDSAPSESPPPDSTGSDSDPSEEEGAVEDEAPDGVIEVEVRGERQEGRVERGAGDFRIEGEVLQAAPRSEGSEVLRTAPGLYIGRAEGGAIAHNYTLRGFDAEHGQDIAFRVGGLPINLPSHIHGQGYADLGFLIGDVVQRLDVREGVYDPEQGDFAVAGSIDVALGVPESQRGIRLRSSYGAFSTFRQLVLWAPEDAPDETFGAVQYAQTAGFGQNRRGRSGSAIAQLRLGEGPWRYRLITFLSAARSQLAGVVRRDDSDAGRVCFECVYPLATARAQSASSTRAMIGAFADYEGAGGASGQVGLWAGYDAFRLQSNFTGFIEASETLNREAGRGDLIEQRNRTTQFGLNAFYRTAPYEPVDWLRGQLELGVAGRIDLVSQTQNLIDAGVRLQTWDERDDSDIRATDLGFYGDIDFALGTRVRLRAGMRADLLSYEIDDRLANRPPPSRRQDGVIPGFRRSALGVAFGPRTSVRVEANDHLALLLAYGEGYRSPPARILADNQEAPFSKVRSVDAGVHIDAGDALQLRLGAYYTRLSDDLAFDVAEGRLERIGATRRLGGTLHIVSEPTSWLLMSGSLTYVDAELLETPTATAEDPDPQFFKGQNLPFVPPFVARMDLGAHGELARLGGHPLRGRIGLGFSALSGRPLPFGERSEAFALLDASASLGWRIATLRFEAFNVLDQRYGAVEYNFASDWTPNDGFRSRVPARHSSAGAPFSWLLSLELQL